ncbi:MAG TPA: sigma-70 family RNA polymerase sigma factor [Kofleriaceae bacterium]|nr:sigma-70 family RNA polymerase sigma factor [Kofleriaceae bacterium]
MTRAAEPSAEELLAHADWLRRLARALVGDAAADDVVQETYEVALTSPPKQEGALRPWLGGVARNLARMSKRSGARREARDAQVVVPEAPTPDELVSRATMQHRVAALVLELEEPLRATLMLRYYEGMSAADIARAQGVPAGTVRWRLKQAVDQIRARLDEEHQGDRKRWVLLLAPFAPQIAPALPAAPLAGSLVMKGLAVKTGTKVVVLLALVIALVAGTRVAGVWGKKKGTPAATAAVKDTGSKPVAPVADPTPGSGNATAPASRGPVFRDDDPRGTLRIEGIVVDESDQGVAGAKVAIDAAPPMIVETESDGSFVFDGLIARDYRVEATAGEKYAGPARLRLTEKAEPLTLRLKTGGILEVVVTDRDGGKAIAGADVELRAPLAWSGKTGADGVATLRGVGPTWGPLAVSAKGFAPASVLAQTTGDPKSPDRIAVSLGKGAAFAGTVVDEAGKPVGGARVTAALVTEPFPVIDPRRDGVVTDDDGAFAFPALASGTYRMSATDATHAAATSAPITVDGVNARKGLQLVMTAGGVVRGTVTDGNGTPVAAADVRVVTRGYVEWRPRRQAFSDADGRFSIAGLPRRGVEIVAWHPTGSSAIAQADLTATAEHEVKLVLDVTGAITGTIVDPEGEPVGDAQVIAKPLATGNVGDRESWTVRGVQEAVSDAGGAFRFAGLPAGSYKITAARPGASENVLWGSDGVVAKPGDAPLRLTVSDDGGVTGKVVLADGKTPSVFAIEILGGAAPVPMASKDGSFTVDAPAGNVRVHISGPGFLAKEVPATVEAGKVADLGTITLEAGRSVSGRVLDANGAPVAGAKVAGGALLTGGGTELYIETESIMARSTETDADGRYVMNGFGPHRITLLAGKDGVGRSQSIGIARGPDSATVDLVLQPVGGIDGKVVRDGQPLADTVVIANPVGATSSNFFVVTGPDGTFALDALAGGEYFIYPMMGGGGSRPKDMAMRWLTITPGKRESLTIDASPGPGKLTVTVNHDKGAPVVMAQVVVFQATGISAPNMGALRDGTFAPPEMRKGATMMLHFRQAVGAPAEITEMRPATYTLCVVPLPVLDPSMARFMMDKAEELPMKCQEVTVGDRPVTATVVVPFAWTVPPAPPKK